MQIRERSRWARRTGSDGEDSCDHVQNTARGVVSRAPSRRSSKRSSAGKAPICKNGEHDESLMNTQVEDAVDVEVEVIKAEGTCSDIASLTQQSAQSDSSLTTASAAREKETQDSSKSEAKHLNDTLQRANLAKAELMDDVERSEQESSLNAERDRHAHREQRHEGYSRSHRCSNVHKCQWTEVGGSRERPSIKRRRD